MHDPLSHTWPGIQKTCALGESELRSNHKPVSHGKIRFVSKQRNGGIYSVYSKHIVNMKKQEETAPNNTLFLTKKRRTSSGASWEDQFSGERRSWGFLNHESLPGIKARGSRTSGELWITLQSWETRWNEILQRSLRDQQPFNARLLPSSILTILFISGFSSKFSIYFLPACHPTSPRCCR